MKTAEPGEVAFPWFSHRTGRMHWAEGFIAADWGTTNRRAYRSTAESASTSSRTTRASWACPRRAVRSGRRRNPRALGDRPSAARRHGRIEPRLDRGALCALPAGIEDLVANGWSGPKRAARRSFRACPSSIPTKRTSCAARKSSCSAPSRPAWSPRTRWSAIPAPTTNGRAWKAGIARFSTVMTWRAVQPSPRAQHPRRPPLRPRRARATRSRGASRGLEDGCLTAELFKIRARVLLGQADAEGCRRPTAAAC